MSFPPLHPDRHDRSCLVILDFGGQYTQLIARKVRALSVYAIVLPYTIALEKLLAYKPGAVILSGGPSSVYDEDAPRLSFPLKELTVEKIPLLGICYGLQYIVQECGGVVKQSTRQEFGEEQVCLAESDGSVEGGIEQGRSQLLQGLPKCLNVWMSHGDAAVTLPSGFVCTLKSSNAIAAMEDASRRFYCLQFHPEVHHCQYGEHVLENFVSNIARLPHDWKMGDIVEQLCVHIKDKVGQRKVLMAVSGGVDSTVLAVLMHRAIGKQAQAVFVNNGLLRLNEAQQVQAMFKTQFGIELLTIDDGENFLRALQGVQDPEEKRRIVGRRFTQVFMPMLGKDAMLAQGTLYTDVIESVKTFGPSKTIKTHHNRVEEVLQLDKEGRLIEPFTELFKDEVRTIGNELGIAREVLMRHPFPGPGLSVRILGEVTPLAIDILQRSDAIYLEELKKWDYYDKLWQCFAVFLPIRSVGVVGDNRGYGHVVALRAVAATDGMTADFAHFSKEFLTKVSSRIIGEVAEVSRVVLDISQKPPATIEWE